MDDETTITPELPAVPRRRPAPSYESGLHYVRKLSERATLRPSPFQIALFIPAADPAPGTGNGNGQFQ